MSNSRFAVSALIVMGFMAIADVAQARSIRVDSGAWDLSGFLSGDSTQSIGFAFEFFGITTSQVDISTNGSLQLSEGGDVATLLPFFDPTQSTNGISVYQTGITNAAFNQAGIDAGFRVSWQFFDFTGALQNEYQAALWDLAGDLFAFEFNYNGINFGSDATSQIGYSTSAGENFDLPTALDLTFADYSGFGDDEFSNNCANTPNALACNNFFFNTMQFGPGTEILPNIANGFFRRTDANDDGPVGTVQGRYLFQREDMIQVPEPSSLALLGIGLFGLGLARRKILS